MNIPIYRAKKIDRDEYVTGALSPCGKIIITNISEVKGLVYTNILVTIQNYGITIFCGIKNVLELPYTMTMEILKTGYLI